MTMQTKKAVNVTRPDVATTEQVIAQVHELIKCGELRPGDRLPPEREFARQLGISRPSLRAGLRSLIAMGVLRARQGSGTYVSDGPPKLDSEQLSLLAALHGFTYEQMFEARRVIEVNVAGLAAERARGNDMASLAEELAAMHAHISDPRKYLIHDIRFHRAIAAASGNPILATLMEMVSAVMYEHRQTTIGRAHDFRQSLDMHERIYRAIRLRNPQQARKAMNEHLDLAQQAYATEEAIEQAAARPIQTSRQKTARKYTRRTRQAG